MISMKNLFKYISLFLLLVLSNCSPAKPENELREKINRVRERLMSGTPLPVVIGKIDSFDSDSVYRNFQYRIIREENSIDDTLFMILSFTTNDSLLHLCFDEEHFKNGKSGEFYHYEINKYGLLDYAYHMESASAQENSVSVDTISSKADEKVVFNSIFPMLDEFNPHFSNNINGQDSGYQKANDKAIKMYNEKAEVAVGELYDLLFKK